MKSDSESTISQADITPEQALDALIHQAESQVACERLAENIVKEEFWQGQLSAFQTVKLSGLDKLLFVRCPDCAEKDAEIASLQEMRPHQMYWQRKALESEKERDELQAQLERHIKTGIDLIKLNEESRRANGKIFSELHAKLEKAREALTTVENYYHRRQMDKYEIAIVVGEALKQIGE